MQKGITFVLLVILAIQMTLADSNAFFSDVKGSLLDKNEEQRTSSTGLSSLVHKHQEKRYVPYSGIGSPGVYGGGIDSYYNPYNSRGLGYEGNFGYSSLGGYGGYGGYNNGYSGFGGIGGYGGYTGGSSGSYNPIYNSYYNRLGYSGYRPGYNYNNYPSSYYSGGYGSSIVGSSLGGIGGAGLIPPIPAVAGYNYGIGSSGSIY